MELSSQRIYLIGSFHKFRDRIIKALPKYNFSDPRKHRQSCVLKLAYDDMTEAEECPGALAVFPKGKTRGKMSYAEIAVSVVNGNHLIVVDENENLDPLLKKGAKDYFTSLDDAISFLKTDPKLDSGIKGDIIKKYPADAGDSEIPMKNVYICGTIEDRLRDIVDKAGPYHPDRNFIFKSEDTYKPKFDLIF